MDNTTMGVPVVPPGGLQQTTMELFGLVGAAGNITTAESTTPPYHPPVELDIDSADNYWMYGSKRYEDSFQLFLEYMNVYLMPVIIVIGVSGNLVSFGVFSFSYLRYKSMSIYLAALSASDTGYLVCLFFVWLPRVNIMIFHREVWCQTNVYFMNVFEFVSAWCVVAFTVERFIVVCRPMFKDKLCTPKFALRVMAVITAAPLVFYVHDFWTNGVHYVHTTPLCMPIPKYYDLQTILTGVDLSLTFVIPFIIIILMDVKIIHQLKHLKDKFKADTKPQLSTSSSTRRRPFFYTSVSKKGKMHVTFTTERETEGACEERAVVPCLVPILKQGTNLDCGGISRMTQRQKDECLRRTIFHCQTVRVLLVASTVFLVICLPNNIFKVAGLINELFNKGQAVESHRAMQWKELFQLVYFFNYALDFFIYGTCSESFRKALKRICWCSTKDKIKHPTLACQMR